MSFPKYKWVLVPLLPIILTACGDVLDEKSRLAAMHLPPQGFKADSAAGKSLYSTNCMVCHGASGIGTRQGPPLVDPVYRPAHHADFAFHMAIRDGVRQHHWSFGDMPALTEVVTPEETAHIIAYIREQQAQAGIH